MGNTITVAQVAATQIISPNTGFNNPYHDDLHGKDTVRSMVSVTNNSVLIVSFIIYVFLAS